MSIELKHTAASAALSPQVPAIDPANVFLDYEGFQTRQLFARLPVEMTLDDLKEPAIWRKVQSSWSRLSLRKHDRLIMVSYDESWLAEAWVVRADESSAALSTPRKTETESRYTALFADDKYRVVWAGNGFRVARKSDNHLMTDAVANEALAIRDLKNLYPKRVA